MSLRFVAAGLAAALLASPIAFAGDETGRFVIAQADTDTSRYLSETRPLGSLSDKELKQRVRIGRQLMKGGSLAQDERKKVQAAMRAALQELKSRGSVGKSDAAAGEEGGTAAGEPGGSAKATAESDQGQNQKKKSAQTAAEAPENATAGESDQGQNQKQKSGQMAEEAPKNAATGSVAEYLADNRPLDSMDQKSLRQRLRAGSDLLKSGSLSDADRQRVRQVMLSVRQMLKKQGNKTGKDQTGVMGEQGGKQAGQGAEKSAEDGSAAQYLSDSRPIDQLSERDLRQRMRAGRQLIKGGSLSQEDRRKVQQTVRAARLELTKRGGNAGKNEGNDQAVEGTGTGSPSAENNAKPAAGMTGGNKDAAALDDQALRQRMRAARDQLAGGKLSPEETKALRQKLAADRSELRKRVAKNLGGGGAGTENKSAVDWRQDTREAKALNDRELEGRLAFYRGELGKANLTPEQQAQYRLILDRDRQEFRARALALKDERVRKLKNRVASKQLKIEIDINLPGPVGAPPPPVWAAEADDQMIVDQLVRRPARKFDRRYSFEEVTAEPELRQAMPAVEVDTVTFGFNEDFVREEQMENLDRIGGILEEILAEHPQEVFLVEGHTDAVGDDAYNLDLSRRRAESIKTALTQYYEIGPENLRTVGYGERYLKIPTEEPEEENRRITIRRITPAVGAQG